VLFRTRESFKSSRMVWNSNPFLHYEASRIYNPLTDRALSAGDGLYESFRSFVAGGEVNPTLAEDGWIVPEGTDLSRRYRLKIVSLETLTTCNQRCYFCPVSVDPREDEAMPDAMFDSIVQQLTAFRSTLEGVFLQSYNEPTVDHRFVDLCRRLFEAQLPVAVLSNGSGMTPRNVDALMRAGTLRFLCINLSTLDRERYVRDRGVDHLEIVLRNLEYMRDRPVADQMRIVVLGEMNDIHRRDFEEIRERFAGSRFDVEMHHATDRAGWLEVGKNTPPIQNLAGCDLLGSRPIQHLHITPSGACILCCQDYDADYVVGDLSKQTVIEVMEGNEMARMRKMAYGLEEAPDDFICRRCTFALSRDAAP
jgi:pyruvate-formate lyase-activating enzyme